MANRYTTQFPGSLEKKVVNLWLKLSFGASGAPTISRGKGISSVTRTSAGLYVITLGTPVSLTTRAMVDKYNALLGVQSSALSSAAAAAPEFRVVADAVSSAGTITIQYSAGGVATDPASGEAALLALQLSNSAAA